MQQRIKYYRRQAATLESIETFSSPCTLVSRAAAQDRKPGARPILVLCVAIALSLTAFPQQPGGLDQPLIVTVGHGSFIGPGGKTIVPDREFTVRAHRYYINSLQRQLSTRLSDSQTAGAAQKLIYSIVTDEILANGLFIDWLLERVKPADNAT